VQRFLGLVQYLVHFMPDVTLYTSLLSVICRNGQPFYWKPLHEACFTQIKAITCRLLVLRPINPMLDDPIWVICDASMSGIGVMYGQGETWQTCRPAGFMSKKFTTAQMNYRVFEMETIAILEALLKWEDKLLGCKIHIVTDHKALEFFKMQQHLNSRQARWMEFLACFDFDINYVKGETNLVADLLSRYHESDHWDESYNTSQYVNTDARLSPEGEDLPWYRFKESRAMWDSNCPQCQCRTPHWADEPISFAPKHHVIEHTEARQCKAAELATHKESGQEPPVSQCMPLQDRANPMILESLGQLPDLHPRIEGDCSILHDIKNRYAKDPTFAKVLKKSEHHKNFEIADGLIYTCNRMGESVLCIPSVVLKKRRLPEIIIAQAHETLGHFGPKKTADYICCHYWWPCIGQDVEQYCKTCPICQTTKSSTQRVPGLLHSLPIPMRPWGSIAMDFIGPFPESDRYNYLWVVICCLMSMVHLVPIRTTTTVSELAWIYIREIVWLHGLAESIVSDRDLKFISKFWHETHKLLGMKLLMSMSFHPQTDGASERVICSVAQILHAAVQPDQQDWSEKILMVEFALNSAISNSSGFAPFELNYGHMPSISPGIIPTPSKVPGIRHFVVCTLQNLADAHDTIIESCV
jgi:RNase H-like domain found in reverse transcriptase/Integrase zinc binding domain